MLITYSVNAIKPEKNHARQSLCACPGTPVQTCVSSQGHVWGRAAPLTARLHTGARLPTVVMPWKGSGDARSSAGSASGICLLFWCSLICATSFLKLHFLVSGGLSLRRSISLPVPCYLLFCFTDTGGKGLLAAATNPFFPFPWSWSPNFIGSGDEPSKKTPCVSFAVRRGHVATSG